MATEKVQVNVYLDKKIVRKLDELRKEDGLSRSATIGRLVRRYLRKREKRKAGEPQMDAGERRSEG
jgi:metal-responsive CopG/Arc/MetJ family transcriptional regulator